MTDEERQYVEHEKCRKSALYFIVNYVKIYDAVDSDWVSFDLWLRQRSTLQTILDNLLVIILKARQLGLTWLSLAYALWLMVYHPAAEIGVFSRRETEALYLLSDERLRGMYDRLPDWMKVDIEKDSGKIFKLSNGSTIRAFPTSAGDSYTFTLVIADEFDLAPDQNKLMRAVKPTIDNGGRMIVLSRVDKSAPLSEFKKIYRAAKQGINDWVPVFLPWNVHPKRDDAWYKAQKDEIYSRTGSLDDLYEQYPATEREALQAKVLNKRIPPHFLERCYIEQEPIQNLADTPIIPGLEIYLPPKEGRRYVIGADPAEGNPTSDPSAATVLDLLTGEEMAVIHGRHQITVFADYVAGLAKYYNKAMIMVERNNHGHAVIAWLLDNTTLSVLEGWDAYDDSGKSITGRR